MKKLVVVFLALVLTLSIAQYAFASSPQLAGLCPYSYCTENPRNV